MSKAIAQISLSESLLILGTSKSIWLGVSEVKRVTKFHDSHHFKYGSVQLSSSAIIPEVKHLLYGVC